MKIVGEENSCQGKIDCDILCQGMINENFDELRYLNFHQEI